ncbi:MAG: gstA [Verrucomicrobiaceae bacterium]|nr:gstA [Verrucomicrobiaceae bacterium]
MTTRDLMKPITLHRFNLSGHCHRIELFLSLLELPFSMVDVNLAKGEQNTAAFLQLIPFGQVPVIEDGDVVLADSNAILVYLAKKYGSEQWLPHTALGAAHVERWLAVAAGLLAFGPAGARRITVFGAKINADEVHGYANELLKVMDAELREKAFLLGAQPTIADIANYTYIAHAPEGNVSLTPYPNIRAWLARIESLPNFVPMQKTKIGCAA